MLLLVTSAYSTEIDLVVDLSRGHFLGGTPALRTLYLINVIVALLQLNSTPASIRHKSVRNQPPKHAHSHTRNRTPYPWCARLLSPSVREPGPLPNDMPSSLTRWSTASNSSSDARKALWLERGPSESRKSSVWVIVLGIGLYKGVIELPPRTPSERAA